MKLTLRQASALSLLLDREFLYDRGDRPRAEIDAMVDGQPEMTAGDMDAIHADLYKRGIH